MKGAAVLAVARILFGCGFTVVVACAVGRWFLRLSGAWNSLTRAERVVFAFGLGAAWLSNAVFVLCAAQLAYPAIFFAAGAALLWLGLRGRSAPADTAGDGAIGPLRWVLLAVAVAYAYLYLGHALAPEISPDGVGYHLELVGRYLRERGFSRITTNMYAALSQGTEMLFVFGYAFGRHSAAKMIHFAFLVATVGALLCFGRRFGLAPAAAVAAAFYACTPVVGVDGTSSYNDCALAFYSFLTLYLLLWWQQNRAGWFLPLIGVTTGFCYAIKYTGFLAVPFALVWILWEARPRARAVAPVALFAAVFIIPWMAKNAILLQNPVAPFFNQVFPNPYFHVSSERFYHYLRQHAGGLGMESWRDYLEIPLELTVRGDKLVELMGPLFLLAPLGLWSLRLRLGRRVWVSAAVFALPWLANIETRFWIPSLVFVSLGIASAIWQMPRRAAVTLSAALVAAHAASSWPSMMEWWNRTPYVWRLTNPPWRAALRIESEQDYLRRVKAEYNVAELVERTVPSGAKVLSPSNYAEAYTTREVLVSHQSAIGEVLTDHLLAPIMSDHAPVQSLRLEFARQKLRAFRLLQKASHPEESWSMHEILLYDGANRHLPQPDWLLWARPNPWDAALALDGSPVTRWRSWWPLYPGMQFEVDFPQPLEISRAEVYGSVEQYHWRLQVEGRDEAGRWSAIPAQMKLVGHSPSLHQMRRLATSEVKAAGIDYLLTDLRGQGNNVIAPDMDRYRADWGLREVGVYGPIRLYYIE